MSRHRKTQPDDGTREEYLVAALRQFEAQVLAAEADRSWTAAVNAKHRAILVRAELDQLRETAARLSTPMPTTTDGHKAELLREVRRLRLGATEAGSYVAATALMKAERDMIAADDAERRAVEQAQTGSASDEELRREADELRAKLQLH